MKAQDKTGFEMDCVYNPNGKANEFCNAHITLDIVEDELEVTIFPESKLSKTELQRVIDFLRRNRLDKIRIDLARDCCIYVVDGSEIFRVFVNDNTVSHLE